MKKTIVLILSFLVFGCGGSSSEENSDTDKVNNTVAVSTQPSVQNLNIPDNTLTEHFKVLLVGNSHVASNNLGGIIELMINTSQPEAEVLVERVSGYRYLADRVGDGETIVHINKEAWTHIVFQAQKYSQSGITLYPTAAAEDWIDLAKQKGATPVLFPEHPQRGNLEEARYVHGIHQSILEKQKSCLAPIGLGWDRVIELLPELEMHAPDGNHAAYPGSFFTALILYQVFTNELADSLPYLPYVPLSQSIQNQLGEIASQILDEHQACKY